MNREVIGAVIGETTPTKISFIIDIEATENLPIQIGEYVGIDFFKSNVAIGLVINIRRENSEIIASLANTPESVQRMKELAMTPGSEIMVADVAVQGFISANGKLTRPRFPTMPGSNVYRNPDKELKIAMGGGQITIGKLRGNKGINVTLNVNKLISRHFSVLAVTGAGKSYTLGVIIDQFMRKFQNAAVLVIDPHEDYFYFQQDPNYGNRVKIFTPSGVNGTTRLKFRVSEFSTNALIEIIGIPRGATKQAELFANIIDTLSADSTNPWGLKEIKEQLRKIKKSEDKRKNTAAGVLRRMRYIPEAAFLDKTVSIPVAAVNETALTAPGQLSIISPGLLEKKGREALVQHVLRKIFDAAVAWRRGSAEDQLFGPVLVIIEEAHQFAPSTSVSREDIIRQIAGEGRKFGVGLGIISQRPGKIDEDVLSQCNTQITLRITNPKDQNAIENASESMSQDLLKDLPGLNTGEAVITGSGIGLPAIVKINERTGVITGGDDVDFVAEWNRPMEPVESIESVEDEDPF